MACFPDADTLLGYVQNYLPGMTHSWLAASDSSDWTPEHLSWTFSHRDITTFTWAGKENIAYHCSMLRKGFEFTFVQIPFGGRHCPLSPLVHIEAVLILVVLIARGKLGL